MSLCKSQKEAMRKAKTLVSKMKSKGWEICVFEHLGWYYDISLNGGLLTVNPIEYGKGPPKFWAQLSDGEYSGTGECFWGDSTPFKDPNQAVNAVMKSAEDFVNKVQKVVLETKKCLERG